MFVSEQILGLMLCKSKYYSREKKKKKNTLVSQLYFFSNLSYFNYVEDKEVSKERTSTNGSGTLQIEELHRSSLGA